MVRVKEWQKNGKKGWEVDLRITLPDGTRVRERVKSPVSSRSGTETWAKKREAQIIAQGGRNKKESEARELAPTLEDFRARYIGEHCEAGRLKPSTIAQKNTILDYYLKPRLGDRRL